jgi:hypothetical protein
LFSPLSYSDHRVRHIPVPITASIAIITTKIIAANTAITKFFSQPQSKKCFTRFSSILNKIIDAMIPSNNPMKTVLIIVPRTTIQIASTNFAFCAPTSALPAYQRTGAKMKMFSTI